MLRLTVAVLATWQGAEAGNGIAAMKQITRQHVAAFSLGSKLTSTDPICNVSSLVHKQFEMLYNWNDKTNTSTGIAFPCCDDAGLFLPVISFEYLWDKNVRAFLYISGLLWCFVGVSVLADAFMAGIEAITAWTTQKKVPRTHRDGSPVNDVHGKQMIDIIEENIWNEKVACLTLFALGSSAPEILIACIGCAPNFFEDALGPGTVVGSATFNLYVITGLCMTALEAGELRKIDGLMVHTVQVTHAHGHALSCTATCDYVWFA